MKYVIVFLMLVCTLSLYGQIQKVLAPVSSFAGDEFSFSLAFDYDACAKFHVYMDLQTEQGKVRRYQLDEVSHPYGKLYYRYSCVLIITRPGVYLVKYSIVDENGDSCFVLEPLSFQVY